MVLEWQAHSPILLSPDSITSMLKSRYPVFSLPAMHSFEANEGRSEETEDEVEGDRYEEGDEIANFLWEQLLHAASHLDSISIPFSM